MGIDLMRVFKGDDTVKVKPSVSALVVFAHKDEDVKTLMQEAIKKEGFAVDRVQKSDEGETMVYSQGDQPKEAMVVRLGDHVLASVAGFTVPQGWVGDLVEEHGFFPDLKMATAALYDQLVSVSKSETPQADAKEMLGSFGQYLDQMMVLPAACFTLDEALGDIVRKADGDPDAAEDTDDEDDADESDDDADETDEADAETPAEEVQKTDDKAKKGETEEEKKKKRLKKHPPSEMAPVDEEDDQKPPPDEVTKSDQSPDFQQAVMSALTGLKDSTTALATKIEAVATEQATQKKTLDAVVQKADTLGATLKSTVIAPPVSEDRPAGAARMRVQKDEDPRTGNFDTAFLRRRR